MTKIIIPSPSQSQSGSFTNHITVDGYTIDLSGGAESGQLLQLVGPSFVPSDNAIQHVLTVGDGYNVDYNSIKAAVDAATLAGASISNPYLVKVYPGIYLEDPISMADGITISSDDGQSGGVNVVANNPDLDLFTMTGGYLTGLTASGVLNPSFALIHCTTNTPFVRNIRLGQCSTGIKIDGYARAVCDGILAIPTAVGQDIDTAIWVDGYGSIGVFLKIVLSVTPDIAALYSKNVIRCGMKLTNQAQVQASSVTISTTYYDNTQVGLYADGYSRLLGQDVVTQNCYNAIQIGAGGSNTSVIIQGGYQRNNVFNAKLDSATGSYFGAPVYIDKSSLSAVPGAVVSGLIVQENLQETSIVVPASVRFPGGRTAQFSNWLLDNRPSGISTGGTVTDAGGLNVSVAAGTGWINDGTTVTNISWDTTNLLLPANDTVYVFVDNTTLTPTFSTSVPGTIKAPIATVVTTGSGIRYIHKTEVLSSLVIRKIQEYLVDTRKFISHAGLGVTQGSTSVRIDIESGSYYRGLDLLPYPGVTDAYFSYFYGTDGYSETDGYDFDGYQYDNGGTLTTMTDGYFRADTVYVTSDGKVSVIYGTMEFDNASDGYAAGVGLAPSFIAESAFAVANVVVLKNVGIIFIKDERTVAPTGITASITDHSQLTGLTADDHPQYLLDNGGRPMSGNLDMGTNSITNVGLVDGVTVSAHGIRHQPGGVDAIATSAPVSLLANVSPSEGSAASLARSDHQHGIVVGNPVSVGLINYAGDSASISRADHVHSLSATGTAGSYSYITFDAYGRETSGALNSILTTSRLTGGGDLSASRTLDLATSGVSAGTYQGVTVDAYGRATSASLINVNTTAGQLTGGGDLNSSLTLGLAIAGTPGTYTFSTGDSITFDTYGRETSATTVTRFINTTSGQLTGGGNLSADRTLGLATSGTAGTYTFGDGSVTFDIYGRQTSASSASNLVLSSRNINTTAGQLTGGGALTNDLTLGLALTGTAGAYTTATGDSFTFDVYGRETAASTVTRNINTTSRLTGGGNLSADRTLDLATSGVSAGTYQGIAVDAYGRATSATLISVNTTNGLTGGGDLNSTRTLGLTTSGTAGTYTFATGDSIIFDAYGRQSSVTTVTRNINTTSRLTGGGDLTADRTLDLAVSGIVTNVYQGIAFDSYGRATAAALLNIDTAAGQLTGGGNLNFTRTLGLAPTGTTGSYSYVTFDAYGRETAGSLISVNTTSGQLTGGGALSSNLALGLATTAVTPGSYTIANVTVDAYGRLTAASSTGTAAPVATGNVNNAGSASTLALSDHVHQTKVDATNAQASNAITTGSATDVLMTNMALTPGAGNWLCMFTCNTQNSNNNNTNTFSVYLNGVQIVATQRGVRFNTGNTDEVAAITTLITGVTAGQVIDVRWHVSNGTGQVTGRELVLVRAV